MLVRDPAVMIIIAASKAVKIEEKLDRVVQEVHLGAIHSTQIEGYAQP